MNKIINDLLTGKDNETHDIGRWSLVFSMFAFFGACIYNAIHSGLVDLERLYMGVAAIVGAHGAAMLMKKDTEPDEHPSEDK
jgi:hypothetical protein